MITGIAEKDLKDETTEMILLSVLLRDGKYILQTELTEKDFSVPYHWKVYTVMTELAITSSLTNETLYFAAKTDDGKEFVTRLAEFPIKWDTMAIDAGIAYLKELNQKRCILARLKDAVGLLRDEDSSAADILAAMSSDELFESATDFVDSAEIMERIAKGVDKPNKCYATGISSLDRAMGGGMYAGWTYGIAGPAKGGKTTMAHTISHNLGMKNIPHAYVAMEMGASQIQQRNMARMMNVNSMVFQGAPEIAKQKADMLTFYSSVKYLDAPGIKPDELMHKLIKAKHKFGITGFILDYWQIIGGKAKGESKAEYLLDVAQGISNFARKHGMWCLFLAQLNDDGSVFASSGLEKACDQLYCIEKMEQQHMPNHRWLRMKATRYTAQYNIGSSTEPSFMINSHVGPFMEEV